MQVQKQELLCLYVLCRKCILLKLDLNFFTAAESNIHFNTTFTMHDASVESTNVFLSLRTSGITLALGCPKQCKFHAIFKLVYKPKGCFEWHTDL
jgi:hypothetical protein